MFQKGRFLTLLFFCANILGPKAVWAAPPVITTPYDKIPDFGATPTLTSITNGNWSSPSTWSLGRIPTDGDVVAIAANTIITYDAFSNNTIQTVAIKPSGQLIFRTDINTRLTVANLLVMDAGELQIGTANNPVASNVKAEVIFIDQQLDTNNDPFQYGNGLIGLGKITMHGAVKTPTICRLAVEPQAGASTLTLEQPVIGWQAGDKIILPDSRQRKIQETGTNLVPELETLTIASVSGTNVTLTAPLQFKHPGARDSRGTLRYLPHVGNLTRNISIRSQSATGTRGHVMFTHRANVDVRYAAFQGLGRTTVEQIDNTVVDALGFVTHLGTNQGGRYPVYMQHLIGPQTTPANGYQYTFLGNTVMCPLKPMPFRWGIALHDSHYGLVKDNVLYNWAGASLVTEDGSESFNTIEHNFCVLTTGKGGRSDDATNGTMVDGGAYWLMGPNNYLRNNISANAGTFGFTYYMKYGNVAAKIPIYKGADPSQSGQSKTINLIYTPILEDSGNEVYGWSSGLTIWWLNTQEIAPNPAATPSVIKDFSVWHFGGKGYYNYATNKLTFDHFVAIQDINIMNQAYSIGIYHGDYYSKDHTIINSDFQNLMLAISPSSVTEGPQLIENSTIEQCHYGVYQDLLWNSSSSAETMAPRKLIIRNVRFGSMAPKLSDPAPFKIGMPWASGGGSTNIIQKDELLVYDYNGTAGDNFQVFRKEQKSDFIVPQTVYNPDGSKYHTASPAAGLTNAQNWAVYGIAISGAIAPCEDVSRSPDILGFTCPMSAATNQPPAVYAGADRSILPAAPLALSGSVRDDGLKNPVSILWTQVQGPGTAVFGTPTAIATTATFPVEGTYVLRLTANDGEYTISDDLTVTVSANAQNNAPAVDLGPDRVANIGEIVKLDPTISDDGLPNPPSSLTSLWTQVKGPANATFANPLSAKTTVVFTAAGVYQLDLVVSDADLSTTRSLTITVNTSQTTNNISAGGDQLLVSPGNPARFADANTVRIYSRTGQKVQQVVGNIWDGKNESGKIVASGIYLFQTDNNRKGKVAVIH